MRIKSAIWVLPLLAAACKEPPPPVVQASIPPGPVAEVLQPPGNCLPPATKTAFELTALKSQLMVAALSCRADEQYNNFVLRNRPELIATDRTLNQWFNRTYGSQGRRRMDDFVTSLANAQSQEGIRQGTSFCGNVQPLFQEVAQANGSSRAVADLAATKPFGAPRAPVCETATPARAPARGR